MVFIKRNSLKSDVFFNLIIIPCFPGFVLFRVQVFQGPSFLWSERRIFTIRVQGPGPGFSSSQIIRPTDAQKQPFADLLQSRCS